MPLLGGGIAEFFTLLLCWVIKVTLVLEFPLKTLLGSVFSKMNNTDLHIKTVLVVHVKVIINTVLLYC